MVQPAAAPYTSDEINAVVVKLVQSSISYPLDTLGVRRTDLTFSDIQQAAAGIFILYPNAPHYSLYLGTKRLNDSITSEAALIGQLLSAIQALGRHTLPITDVSPLFNAQAALENMGAAAAQRGGSFTSIASVPSFQQFTKNTNVFLAGPGQNVQDSGEIVLTPQQARAAIPGLVVQAQQAHAALVKNVTQIVNGIVDYNKVSLPAVVASSVLANASKLVGSDAATLSSLTPDQRLASIRQVVLNLIAAKTVVQTFCSFSGPSDLIALTGTGMPYSDATHLATPAVAKATIGGGVSIVAGVSDDLNLTMDGGTPFDFILSPSLVGELDGQNAAPFVIGNGSSPVPATGSTTPTNDHFRLRVGAIVYDAALTHSGDATAGIVDGTGDTTTAGWYGGGGLLDTKTLNFVVDGVQTYSVTFVAPANATAMLAQINAVTNAGTAVTPHDLVASVVLVGAVNVLQLATTYLGPGASVQIQAGTANSTIGLVLGTSVGTTPARTADQAAADIALAVPANVTAEAYYFPLFYSGGINIVAGVNPIWAVPVPGITDFVALGVTATGCSAQVPSGPDAGVYPITAVTASTITIQGTIGTPLLNVQITIGPANRKVKVFLNNPAVDVPLETALTCLGDTPASAGALNTLGFFANLSSSAQRSTPDVIATNINANTTKVKAGTTNEYSLVSVPAHSNNLNAHEIVFAEAETLGSQSFLGTTLTYTVTAITVPGAISTGSCIALRGGSAAGHGYTVTTVNGVAASAHALAVGDVIIATGSFSGGTSTSVDAEFGPTIVASKYDVVVIAKGQNNGTYFVSGNGATAIDIELISVLPLFISGGQPTQIVASYGVMFLTLSSSNKTTSSSVKVQGSGGSLFFAPIPFTQVGSTPWFQLPSIPLQLQAGDLLETYLTDYKTPSSVYTIVAVDKTLKVIKLATDVPVVTTWSFTGQPPYADLRYGVNNDYQTVQTAMQVWLNAPEQKPLFWTNFNALLNPLLANTAPRAIDIGTAANRLNQLYVLLQGAQAAALGQDPAKAIDSIGATFTVEPVPAIDTMIASFKAKGSDRAIDILLSGQFSMFFGLTTDGVSYAGAFQEAARSVALNDLPVSKINRSSVQTSRVLAQTESLDPEYPAGVGVTEALQGDQVNPPSLGSGTPSDLGTNIGRPATAGR